ncbi:MAG: hypothetical protein COA65_08880 [Rhodospirillaceae bacterium]|nr:MAG: hypothetical protein COA65_08880 [Rhodospirillaceae bacterium]
MSDVTIKLNHPVEHNGETIDEITLRRPKVKDLRKLDAIKGEVEKGVHLVSKLASLPSAVVDEIDAEDFVKISEQVADFLGGSLPTGGTSEAI